MKFKALLATAFTFAFLVAFSMVDLVFGQSLAAGEWKEVARGGDAVWRQANYHYYQSFDNDGDGWILWNYTETFNFQLWKQTINDRPCHIDSCFFGELFHVRDYILFNPDLNWTIVLRFRIYYDMYLWLPSSGVSMLIFNNTEPSPDFWPGADYDYAFNFGSGSSNGDYYIWIWNNGTKLKFRVSFKKSGPPLVGRESVETHTLTFNVPSNFFLNVNVMLKVWKYGASGQITGKTLYERLYVGGPTSDPENIQPLPSWVDSAVKFVIDLFYMLSNLIIGIAPYAGVGIAIWILSGVVAAAETGEFSAMWEPFIKLYSLFTGILGIVQKAVQTITDWIIKLLEWLGLVGVATA